MNIKPNNLILVIAMVMISGISSGQYAPPPGFPGTTAIYQDSSAFYAWAKNCTVTRGFVNISDTNFVYNNSNRASYGNVYMATGKPDGLVLSLGDGGVATLTFDTVISDHIGWDFAVFENSFSNGFLELAYVEVSSDGVRFVRFHSISLTQTQSQVGTFDTIDTRKINNLAGKYRLGYGTPFDLSQLRDSAGLDVSHITHIRVVDVAGCLLDAYAGFDSQNHKINDPWPTPFDTGGFDLDGIGLVHNAPTSDGNSPEIPGIAIIPNPCSLTTRFFSQTSSVLEYQITNISGLTVAHSSFSTSTTVDVSDLPAGMYFVHFNLPGSSNSLTKKILKY